MDWIQYISHSFILLLIVQVIRTMETGEGSEIHVQTSIGTFIGETNSVAFLGKSKTAAHFLGIPFAKPPVGERRFTKPQPYGRLESLYNATYHRPHCIQTQSTYNYIKNYTQSEDCLYLNIYLPGDRIQGKKAYPVMVYIHGGSFVDGGADVYNGDILSAFHDVIVVTINYRLNVFGFLSDGNNLKGNFGLWDMKLAIQWVHDNIEDFGGDHTNVTLFGNSAGGAAVLYQALNPDNRGLFKRVISQSGSCFAFWALQRHPAHNFQWYLSQVGCVIGDFSERMQCLREKPAEVLKLAGTKYTTQFVPTVDQDFLTAEPEMISKRQTQAGIAAMDFFSEIDLMNGVTSKDGAFALTYWSNEMQEENRNANISNGVSYSFFKNKYIPEMLSDMYENIPKALEESTQHLYTDWSKPRNPISVRDMLMKFESDVTFFVPAMYASKRHQKSQGNSLSSNYFYVFNQKPDFAPKPDWLKGATHVMELPYIFGFPRPLQLKLIHDYDANDPFRVSRRDYKLAKIMMTFWTNFAKTGNPNSPYQIDDLNVPEWPTFDNEKQQYLELTSSMTPQSVKHHFAASRVAFWENLAPVLRNCNTNSSAAVFILPVVSWLVELLVLFNVMEVIN